LVQPAATVDGRTPAPPGMYQTLVNTGINYLSLKLVQPPDFSHHHLGKPYGNLRGRNPLEAEASTFKQQLPGLGSSASQRC